MKRFYRVGEKISEITVQGVPLTEFSIVLHSEVGGKGVPPVPPSEAKAAAVLQNYLYRLTDLYLPVLYDKNPLRTDRAFLIGGTDFEEDDSRGERFSDDDFLIRTRGGSVILAGGKRGVLYAVYAFLEKYLGVRYFTKDCERVLWREKIDVGEIDERHSTPFEYREICCWTGWDPDFSVKSRIDGTFVRKLRPEDGDGIGYAGGPAGLVHTFGLLVPPDKYFREHPDWFAENEKGERDPSGICFSNDALFREMEKNAEAWLDAEADPRLVSISINDGNVAYCRCEKCRKVIEKGGNDTDLVLRFVNRMARALRKKYPRLMVDTISYGGTRELPKITKAAEGVAVRVCANGDGRNYPLPVAAARGLPGAKAFTERIEEWGRLSDKIYVWDYPYNYYIINAPFPVLHSLLGTARYFADHKVVGVYINGETDCAEFTELKFYLQAKVLADPYMTEEQFETHLSEFLEGYYGAGWKSIRSYIALAERAAAKNVTTGAVPAGNIPLKRNADGSPDESFIRKARSLFRRALEKADGEGERRRVLKASLQVEYYDLFTLMEEKMQKGSEAEREELVRRNREMYRNFVRLGVTRVVENTFLPVVKNFAQPPVECCFWDPKCAVADRNNETTARPLYVLVPFDDPVGTRVDFTCNYRTNNENPEGFLGAADGKGKIVEDGKNPHWTGRGEYVPIAIRGGTVTTGDEFAGASGLPRDGLLLRLLPMHLRGVVLRVRMMDAGAYLSIADVAKLPSED